MKKKKRIVLTVLFAVIFVFTGMFTYYKKSNIHKKSDSNYELSNSLNCISDKENKSSCILNVYCYLGITTFFSVIFTSIIFKKNKEIKRLNKRFEDLNSTDALTNIPNRRALDEFLLLNWNNYMKMQKSLSFIMIDIDYFKDYNDNYGYLQGDEVLKEVANCLKLSCRKSDFIARYGGEKFTIVMLDTNKEHAIMVASRILENIRKINIKHEYSQISKRITLSIGISTSKFDYNKNYEEYISLADSALYEAKKHRNTFVHKS